MASPYLTARDLITEAMILNGMLAEKEVPNANELQRGFRRLNKMIDSWSLQPLTKLVNTRHVFDITADADEYTIGPTGTLLTDIRPTILTSAALLLNTSDPPVEIPLAVLTPQQYAEIAIKTLSSTQPTSVYYRQTDPNGTLNPYPVPNITTNQFVLYWDETFAQFVDVNTAYQLPSGYAKAIETNLSVELCMGWRVPPQDVERQAKMALDWVKAANVKPTELSIDPALAPSGGGYNILSDTFR